MIQHLCKECGSSFNRYNTIQKLCYNCTKKNYKPINQRGKEYIKWQAFRKEWLIENPPTAPNGLYTCGICFQPIPKRQLQLDHIEPQGWSHKRKYDPSNIQPSHALCNFDKGSKRSRT